MTDAESRPVVVLDSCCVIEWLKDERREEVDAVERLMDKSKSGEIAVLASAAVIAEVLPKKNKHRYDNFRRALDEGEIIVQPLDAVIAEAVAYLREELNFTGARRILDAIHLGTAIHSRADFLCTRDNALIALNERLPQLREHKPAPGFRICKPQAVAFRSVSAPSP